MLTSVCRSAPGLHRRAAADALRQRDIFSGLNDMMGNMMAQMNQTVQGMPDESMKVGAAAACTACRRPMRPVRARSPACELLQAVHTSHPPHMAVAPCVPG